MRIKGAGGGGKGRGGNSHIPTDTPDTLQSVAYAQVIDLVSEGPIVGLENGLKDVYLDGVPMVNPDGTTNFKDVDVAWTDGSQDQGYIPGFSSQESEVSVGVQVKQTTPVVRSIFNTTIDQVRIRVAVPQLTKLITKTGDTVGTSVQLAIDLQNNGGGYVQQGLRGTGVISGAAHSTYERTYLLDLPKPGPWDIRVRRITSDAISEGEYRIANETWWQSYTELTNDKLSYPNSALIAMKVPSKQFSNIPARSFRLKGMIIRVPSNYTPATRNPTTGVWTPATYTGQWDGTFKLSWSSNPAWCYYDYLINKRYGMGRFIDTTAVDKWTLYTIGRYCDEMVPDGHGGTEPRFVCNLYLQESQEAYKVITNFASIFRSMVYWSAGSIFLAQDAPQDPSYQFNQTNVVDGQFSYQGVSKRARHTVAYVTYNDPDNHCKQAVEYVEDKEGVARFGINPLSISAFGCTSRGQAHRLGKWALYSERKEGEVVSFKTALEGAYRHPGSVIDVMDSRRAGKRYGGRIVSSTATQTVIDGPGLSLNEAGVSYELACVLPSGALEKVAVTSQSNANTINHAAFSAAPTPGSVWVITASNLSPRQFRVITVTQNDPTSYSITAVAHDPAKYDEIELGVSLQNKATNYLTFSPPASLTFDEYTSADATGAITNLVCSWPACNGAQGYDVEYRKGGANWTPLTPTSGHEVEVQGVSVGVDYEFRVAANYTGRRSTYTYGNYTTIGKSKPPADVTGFTGAITDLGLVKLSWTAVLDRDLDIYEVRNGTSWASSTLVKQIKTTAFEWTPANASETLWIKALDTSGNYSVNAASVTINCGPTTPSSLTMSVS